MGFKKILVLITVCLLLPQLLYANEQPINVSMAKLGQTVEQMYPLLLDDHLKLNPKNVRKLYDYIDELEKNLNASQQHLTKRSVGYAISYDVVRQFVEQIKLVLESGEVEAAQGMLKSVPSLCGSCHSQDHHSNRIFASTKRDNFNSDFDFAEFNFYTRNYKKAHDYYFRFLKQDLKKANEFKLISALQRLLVMQAQVEKNLPKAQETLKTLLQEKQFPVKVRLDIEQWILGLDEVIEDTKDLKHPITENQLRDIISKFIDVLHRNHFALFASEKEKILFLVMRGWLYDYLNENPPADQVPVLLYWLAQCDRILSFSADYALADLYLKECMVNHAKHPFAKKCFKAYQDFVMFSYTGSGGTDVPEDILEELRILQNIVRPNQHQG